MPENISTERSLTLTFRAFVISALLGCALLHAGTIQIDEKERRISFTGNFARQNIYAQLKGAIEYVACTTGGKEYESLIVCDVDPIAINDALLKIGFKPGQAAHEDGDRMVLPRGPGLKIWIEYNDGKETKRVPVEAFILDTVTGKAMNPVGWAYTGSRESKDPQSGKMTLEVALVKNLISLHHKDPTVLLQNPLQDGANDSRYKSLAENLPKEGTPITMIWEPASAGVKAEVPAGNRRIHLLISGKVQGVGFREFTQRNARQLSVQGWVRNLKTGDVELEALGTEAAMKDFEEKVRKGPRGSQVDGVKTLPAKDGEALGEFEVRDTD